MMYKKLLLPVGILLPLVVLLGACGPAVNQPPTQKTVTINPTFQSQLSPVPTIPTYRCGSWTSNNAPGRYSTITIYARLTKDVAGVSGAMATAVVHFHDEDVTLDQHPTSDSGGYVSFPLSLQGRQPRNIPATIDITFTNFPGRTLHCTSTFFTPQ